MVLILKNLKEQSILQYYFNICFYDKIGTKRLFSNLSM